MLDSILNFQGTVDENDNFATQLLCAHKNIVLAP